MYGELMWKPWELMRARWVDVSLALHGRGEKADATYELFRRVAASAAYAGTNKKFASHFDKFFPMTKKNARVKNSKALDQLRRFKLIEAQKKHGSAGT